MTDSVLFIMGSLMLAVAIVKQRLDRRIAWFIVRMTGTNLYWISFGITAVCGMLAAFIGEHTVAAMMLPVGVTLITLISNDPKKVRNIAAVILFSISYGCSIAGVATPSGGARNAIIISYWKEFFYDATDPATYRYLMDYITWIIYAFPMFLLRLPIVTLLLLSTFKPETTDMSRAVARLRTQVDDGRSAQALRLADHPDLFGITILGWIFLSGTLGLGVVASIGVSAFLVLGLVRWEDINSGVNWGVVLLYAAAISLGVEMTGDAGLPQWVAQSFLALPRRRRRRRAALGLNAAISLLTIAVSNTMTAGAAVAVLGPDRAQDRPGAAAPDPLIIGFVTAISSAFGYLTAAAQPAFTIIYASGYLKGPGLLEDRLADDACLLRAVAHTCRILLAAHCRSARELAAREPFQAHHAVGPPGACGREDAAESAHPAPQPLPRPGVHRRQRRVLRYGAHGGPAFARPTNATSSFSMSGRSTRACGRAACRSAWPGRACSRPGFELPGVSRPEAGPRRLEGGRRRRRQLAQGNGARGGLGRCGWVTTRSCT